MVHNIEKWDGPSIGLRCIWLLVSNTIIKGSPSTFERARTLESKQESRRCAYEEQSSSPQSLSSERKHYSKRKKNSSETRDSWVHGWEISYSFVIATLVTPPCLTIILQQEKSGTLGCIYSSQAGYELWEYYLSSVFFANIPRSGKSCLSCWKEHFASRIKK